MVGWISKKDRNKGLEKLADKLSAPEEAVSVVKSGDRVFVGSACATPRVLIRALEEKGGRLDDVRLLHFLTDGAIPMKDGVPETRFRHKVFFVGTDSREAIKQGKAQYVPVSIAHLPQLIENEVIPVDVALIQVSLPDEDGRVSLGVSVDITRGAALKAGRVVAEVNPNMPYTLGDSTIPADRIDHFVKVDSPLIEYVHEPADAVAKQIARYVARIVRDHSTLHIGIGRIPNEMLKYLTSRKDLSIHSDVITEPVLDLMEKGVITGPIAASFCMGTKRLYDAIHRSPRFSFYPIDHICSPGLLSGIKQLVSVTQALCIDLMGQVCADQFCGEFYSGICVQPDFIRAAAASPGGKPIICLSSTTDDGKESRIRPLLREGEGVTVPRADVHYVVTEYGCAYLFCKSIQEKALALIEIAHPEFRPWLLEEAIRLGYVRKGQKLQSQIAYPEEEECEITLKSGHTVRIRPSKASDVRGIQDVFYHMRKEDVYLRFFVNLPALDECRADPLCNVDYENQMAFTAVTGDPENEKVVGCSCYFVDADDGLAEVAYMIQPDWQGLGLGTALQHRMEEYARSKGIRGFKAYILTQNQKMQRLIQKGVKVTFKRGVDEYEVVSLF